MFLYYLNFNTFFGMNGLQTNNLSQAAYFCLNIRHIVSYLVCLSLPAFCAVSHPSSSVLQGFTGIARHGLRGYYYNGLGASFIRAVPCALLNYTLTRKLEVLFDSTWSWVIFLLYSWWSGNMCFSQRPAGCARVKSKFRIIKDIGWCHSITNTSYTLLKLCD